MISIGIEGPSGTLPGRQKEIDIIGNPSFFEGLTACLQIVFAYSGSHGFVTVMAEMEDVGRDFTPALVLTQSFAIPTYTTVAVVVYILAGKEVQSLALLNAPHVPSMVAWGALLPCLVAVSIVMGHTAIKYLFILCLRRKGAEQEYCQNTKRAWALWTSLGVGFWILSFVLANALPNFDAIAALMAALIVSWLSFGFPPVLWLYLNWTRQFSSGKKMALAVLNWALIAGTVFASIAGTWAGVKLMQAAFSGDQNRGGPFSCANNSV